MAYRLRTGIINLPLHQGRAPRWLFERMVRLARELVWILVWEYGREGFLERLSDPLWFQALGCVMGFDWHSSGLTTTVCGALKEALKGREKELGIFIAGGKGRKALETPEEIARIGERYSLPSSLENLIQVSRLTAKVDNSCLQDGFQLYHHILIFTPEGKWGVIQQGMNPERGWARRYHWLHKEGLNFLNDPHQGIISEWRGEIFNLATEESSSARKTILEMVKDNPLRISKDLRRIKEISLPAHHPIKGIYVDEKRIIRVLREAKEIHPDSFQNLLLQPGIGSKTLRALALVAELIYGEKVSRKDPARYSFAHGGKDGYPYPVNLGTYEESIEFLKDAVNRARLGNQEKIHALRRLANLSSRL